MNNTHFLMYKADLKDEYLKLAMSLITSLVILMEKQILAAVSDTSSTDGKVSDLRTKEVPSQQAS